MVRLEQSTLDTMKFYPILCIVSMMVCYSAQVPSRIWGTRWSSVRCTNVKPSISCTPGILDCDSYCEYVEMYHDRILKNNTECAFSDPPKECPSRSPTYCAEYCHPHVKTQFEPTECIKSDLYSRCPRGPDCKIWCDYFVLYTNRYKRGEHECAISGPAKSCPHDDAKYCPEHCHPVLFPQVWYGD